MYILKVNANEVFPDQDDVSFVFCRKRVIVSSKRFTEKLQYKY